MTADRQTDILITTLRSKYCSSLKTYTFVCHGHRALLWKFYMSEVEARKMQDVRMLDQGHFRVLHFLPTGRNGRRKILVIEFQRKDINSDGVSV